MEHKQVAAVACCLAGADDPKAAANRQDAVTKLLSHIDKQRVVVTTDAAAPVVEALNGQHVKIPGFVVPLDASGETVKEILLVPYFGACVHVPPPPSNQIVHVTL